VGDDVILNILDRKFVFGDSSKAFDPIFNVELLGGEVLRHRKPPNRQSGIGGVAEEL
jgi:hypothetical protein